ncbi:MAG: hypothetical protein LBG58_12080 [Planctomycetaceae bacterium]|jgi:hypothetical protein|nr:hypothetical protein [Planctomycetaceae bacterium]
MATTYTAVTNIKPVTAITNADIIVLFVPFKETSGSPTLDLSTANVRIFNNPGDITISGTDIEQVTLQIGGKFNYEINGAVSQGDLTFPYSPDPTTGPPKLLGLDENDVMSVAMSPQGVLYLAKKDTSGEQVTGTTKYKVWGMVGANFVSADAISWAKGNTQSATAKFKCTGTQGVWGYANCLAAMVEANSGSTGHISITEST